MRDAGDLYERKFIDKSSCWLYKLKRGGRSLLDQTLLFERSIACMYAYPVLMRLQFVLLKRAGRNILLCFVALMERLRLRLVDDGKDIDGAAIHPRVVMTGGLGALVRYIMLLLFTTCNACDYPPHILISGLGA
jgi:hypothetical protein